MSDIKLIPYQPKKWVSELKQVPKVHVKLAQTPTPIQKWKLKEFPEEFSVSIKREDYAGSLLTGNKVRKLEFFLADAISKESTCVITCGGLQSNHCRATAVAAKQLGLDCHLLLGGKNQEDDTEELTSNILLNMIHDAKCYMVPFEKMIYNANEWLSKLADDLRKAGERPYIIPIGGSSNLGTFGIINSFAELIDQGVLQDFDDIILATGSGGTLAGIAISNYLTGQKLRVHGVCVTESSEVFHEHVNKTLLNYGITQVKSNEICDVIDGYIGLGYSKTTDQDLDLMISICQQSGVLLDYCYTLKAVKGLMHELQNNPSRFKGNRILFIHTGGSFTVFDGTINKKLQEKHRENTIV